VIEASPRPAPPPKKPFVDDFRYAFGMTDVSEYLDGLNLPKPLDAARASAYQALRENHAVREEVKHGEAALIPASVLNEDSSISICYIRIDELRLYLRVIETEEAARAVAVEALTPEVPCFLPDDFYPGGAPLPDFICVRTR
jgi:hypothetical protein